MNLTCYILAKNEEANIGRCIRALQKSDVSVFVLDSHSTDDTARIACELGATVEEYDYTSHAEALETICAVRTRTGDMVMILDADMVVSAELLLECREVLKQDDIDVVAAPIQMYWNGRLLRWGSLCPPKAFAFRGGKSYFEATGHGERLRSGVKVKLAKNWLVHNDRKSFGAYLESQFRYSRNLFERASTGRVSLRDRLRSTPLMMATIPLLSYLFRGGFLCGRTGLVYALDRLIAETIMFRQLIAGNEDDAAEHDKGGEQGLDQTSKCQLRRG